MLYANDLFIRKDAQVNGLFYICPAFNEMILAGARIGVHHISRDSYISLATPQNVDDFDQRLSRSERKDNG